MKNLSFLIIVLLTLAFSCGVKQTPANTTKKIAKIETPKPPKEIVEEVIEVPIPKPPKSPKEIENNDLEVFNHNKWSRLLKKYVSNNGNVNYKGFKNESSKLKAYIKLLGENLPTNAWTKEDKLAYWMNAYNALTVDLIVQNYPIKSIKNIDNPWKQRLWKLGSKWYNLDGIEHQILRKMNEPRIHFGIACASYSCPKLLNEAFTASNVEAQLEKATKAFIADKKHNEISENKLHLSKIFKWFAKDFKQNGNLIDFLNKYAEVKISKNAKKSFTDYNWALNE